MIVHGMITASVSEIYRFVSEHITEIIVSGMEAYIPHTFSSPKAHKPWFNLACSRAIYNREVTHKRYLSLPSPDTQAFIFMSGITPNLFSYLPNTHSSIENVKVFLILSLLVTSGV